MLNRDERKREGSKFFARELLYEYNEGLLEGERFKIVAEALKTDASLVEELKWLKQADEYCDQLAETTLSDEFRNELLQARLPNQRRLDKMRIKNWPDSLRWGLESLILSAVVATVAILLPWQELMNWRDKVAGQVPVAVKVEKKEEPPEPQEPPEPKVQLTEVVKPAEKIVTEEKPEVVKTPEPIAAAPTVIPKPTSAPAPMLTRGSVTHMLMEVANIEAKTPAIRDQLLALGAIKAGQVELGWRNATGNYFHFSIPEKNLSAAIKTLEGYGPVRIYKLSHPRIMPEGAVRIILTIKNGEPAAEKKANEPEATESKPAGETPSEEEESAAP